jgi:Family of unknown function (DUF6101)
MIRPGLAAGDQPQHVEDSGGPLTQSVPAALVATPHIERICGVRILRGCDGWQGIALQLDPRLDDNSLFRLSLMTANGHAIQVACLHEEDAIASWRSLSASTGLAMLVETPDGRIEAPFPQLGPIKLGHGRQRRSYNTLHKRRPRFLTRRKTARLAAVPVHVHGIEMSGYSAAY